MVKNTRIHGHKVMYEEDSKKALDYLRNDLSSQEARVFFDQARSKGSAQFEDDEDRNFTLIYRDGVYILNRRDSY